MKNALPAGAGSSGSFSEFKVGICWQGNRHHLLDYHRSVPLTAFAPLAKVPGVRLISLQKGYGSEQVQKQNPGLKVSELESERDPQTETFVDTAAIIRHLDLVITVDTAIAHLAGGLGVPVWVALSQIVDWRWMAQREDCPWYPSMRLFRQTHLGEWDPVFGRMAGELHRLIRSSVRPEKPGGFVGKSSPDAVGKVVGWPELLEARDQAQRPEPDHGHRPTVASICCT